MKGSRDESTAAGASERRLRVVHLVGQLHLGGMESVVVAQAIHLDRDQFQVEVWSLSGGEANAAPLREEGIPVRSLGKGRGFDARFLAAFRRLLREDPVDILHAHNAPAARWALCGVLGLAPSSRPVLIKTEHTFDSRKALGYLVGHAIKGLWFDGVIGVSEDTTRRHRGLDPIWASRYRTILNGISLGGAWVGPEPDRAMRSELGIPAGDRLLVNLGNLRPPKGQRLLLEAFGTLAVRQPNLRLAIVGDGPLRGEFEQFVSSRGLSGRVHFLGHRTDAARILATADVVVQSSVREGLPVSLLEAARVSRPIVATDVGGTRELIADGATGLLIRPGSVSDLVAAIDRMLADPALASRLAMSVHLRLRECFQITESATRLGKLYKSLHVASRLRIRTR